MRNWSDGNVLQTTPTGSTYVPATGALTVVIPDPAVAPVAVSYTHLTLPTKDSV